MMSHTQWSTRFKREMKQIFRMQLFIAPIALGAAYYFATPISEEEKRKLQANYQRNAGWKRS